MADEKFQLFGNLVLFENGKGMIEYSLGRWLPLSETSLNQLKSKIEIGDFSGRYITTKGLDFNVDASGRVIHREHNRAT